MSTRFLPLRLPELWSLSSRTDIRYRLTRDVERGGEQIPKHAITTVEGPVRPGGVEVAAAVC